MLIDKFTFQTDILFYKNTQNVPQLGTQMSGRSMVRELSKETKAEVFWPFEKK